MKDCAFYFKQLELGPMANFIYLFGDPSTRTAAVVDPAWDVGEILKVAEKDGYQIRHVLVSHGHPDHINGVEELLHRTNAELHMHKDEVPWVEGWKSTAHRTDHGDRLRVGELEVQCLHTPGHTPGSQCFLFGSTLLSGDTLFVNSCGRTDLPGGNPRQLFESLTGLMKLDDQVLLFPGHNYGSRVSSTMGQEKKSNPVLQCTSVEQFLRMMSPADLWA